MSPQLNINFEDLDGSDLQIDAIYRGGTSGNVGDDPISRILGTGNQGGFRPRRRLRGDGYAYIVLYSDGADPDWPDFLDTATGIYAYYGDNKSPGYQLEDTPRRGNKILSEVFKLASGNESERISVPPFLLFTKYGRGRDVYFRGLAVPGTAFSQTEDLVAVWKTKEGQRFQNYRSMFTVLNVESINRAWLNDLLNDDPVSSNCPSAWLQWVRKRQYHALKAPHVRSYRTKNEQLPANAREEALIRIIINHFKNKPVEFEGFANRIVSFMDNNVVSIEGTRPTRDGGRDGIGKYRIRVKDDSINLDFAVEAKCYSLGHSVGVKEVARLISRLRYRQFGVLITTSFVSTQAYQEIREDMHPIVVIAARDIARLLMSHGLGSKQDLVNYLNASFPLDNP